MNKMKFIAGILMLLLGCFLSLMVLITHSGHTSSSMDTGEYILFTVGGLVLLTGGFYAVRTANKKNEITLNSVLTPGVLKVPYKLSNFGLNHSFVLIRESASQIIMLQPGRINPQISLLS